MYHDLKSFIADVPDFPKPGILFRDISPLLKAPHAFRQAIASMAQLVSESKSSSIVAIESRGFIFAAPVAHEVGIPLVLVRKPGKLPGERIRIEYGLEYGSDALELKSGMIEKGTRVAVIDDVLATGGTARATGDLIKKVGATVGSYIFLLELLGLGGRERLAEASIASVIQYS